MEGEKRKVVKKTATKKTVKKPVKKKETPEQITQRKAAQAAEKQKKDIENFFLVCREVEMGESVRSACKGLMDRGDFYDVIALGEEYRNHYARACESRQEMIFEDIKDISDNANADLIVGPKGNLIVDGEAVQRSRLKIEARKWMLGKMNPKKYGDKLDLTTDGEKVGHIDVTKISDDVLTALIDATNGSKK